VNARTILDIPIADQDNTHQVQHGAEAVRDVLIGNQGSNTAFVTFNNVADQLVAREVMLAPETNSENAIWHTHMAPEVRDIVWKNAAIPASQTRARRNVSRLVVSFGYIAWSIPIFFIQTFVTVGYLLPRLPALQEVLEKIPGLISLLTLYLPVWALMLLMMLLPRFFLWLALSYEGKKTKHAATREALRRAFWFQLASIYLSVVAGGTLAFFWFSRMNGAQCLMGILSLEIPRRGVYFSTFVIARAGFSIPMLLFYPLLCSCSPEERPVTYCDFAAEWADIGLVLSLGLTYMVISPAMLLCCLVYFIMAVFTYLWLFAYTYSEEFDSNGLMWHDMFNGTMVGLIFGTLVLIGQLQTQPEIFNFSGPHLALCCLFALQLLFFLYCYLEFELPSKRDSLHDAVQVDHEWAKDPNLRQQLRSDCYMDPIERDVEDEAEEEDDADDDEEDDDSEMDDFETDSAYCSWCH